MPFVLYHVVAQFEFIVSLCIIQHQSIRLICWICHRIRKVLFRKIGKKSSNNKKGQRHLTNGKFQSRTHHCDSCAKLSDTIATGIVLLLHQVNCCLMVDSCGCMRYQPYCYGHSLMRRLSNCLWNPSFLSSCFSLNVNDNKILRIGTIVFVRTGGQAFRINENKQQLSNERSVVLLS